MTKISFGWLIKLLTQNGNTITRGSKLSRLWCNFYMSSFKLLLNDTVGFSFFYGALLGLASFVLLNILNITLNINIT